MTGFVANIVIVKYFDVKILLYFYCLFINIFDCR